MYLIILHMLLQVVEIEAEPSHSVIEDSQRGLDFIVSAISDYAKCKALIQEVNFMDTLLFQTRVYSFSLFNIGQITLSYTWVFTHMDGSPVVHNFSQPDFDKETGHLKSDGGEVMPFSITPSSGQVAPGKEMAFVVHFSPLDVNKWKYKLVCRLEKCMVHINWIFKIY